MKQRMEWNQYRSEQARRNGVYDQACARAKAQLAEYQRGPSATTRAALMKTLREIDAAWLALGDLHGVEIMW